MKRISLYFLLSIFVLGSMACSLGSVLDTDKENVSPVAITAIVSPQEPTAFAKELPTPSTEFGFLTGTPVDISSLPDLNGVSEGGEPSSCYSETSEPSINLGYGIFPYQSLCLNNFPIAPDSPGIILTLVDSAGHSYSESYTYSQNNLIDSTGKDVGYIDSGEGIDGNPGTPGVSFDVYWPANFPCGDWLATATTQDGAVNVAPTPLNVPCDTPRISVLSDLSVNPFRSPDYGWEGPIFTTGETINVAVAGFSANTAITIAFYQQDMTVSTPESGLMVGNAVYATTLMTDASGNLQAPFVVGSETQRGAFYVVAAPEITEELHLYPMSTRFSIE